ncbi:MAG: response regulator [Devosia sp.]|nr:response regulator [Devosia sp.]
MKSDVLPVLIVEDEGIVEMMMEEMVRYLGCKVLASSRTLDRGIAFAESEDVDFALLDYDLGDGTDALPIAEALAERDIPFVFVTAHPSAVLQQAFPDVPVLIKPLQLGQLERVMPLRRTVH